MHFNPKALLVTAVFAAALWFALEGGFGFAAGAIVMAIAMDVVMSCGVLGGLPDWLPRRVRRAIYGPPEETL